MNIGVVLFGSLAELAGKSRLEVNGCKDLQSLKDKMMLEFPELKNSEFLISVDRKIIKNNPVLNAGNEVAFLPPFAGG